MEKIGEKLGTATVIGVKSAKRIIAAKPLVPKGYVFTVCLPLPTQACNPNSRCHWANKAKAMKVQRLAAQAQTIGLPKSFNDPEITVTFYCKAKRARDRDNAIASLKGAIDGLADAGLFANDSAVHWGTVTFEKDATNPRVVLMIREKST